MACFDNWPIAGSTGPKFKERELNFLLSVVKGAKPRESVEAMLAAQMAAVHIATMTLARRFAPVETILQQDSADDTNANPKPFTRTKDPNKIIAAAKRGHQVLDSIH